MDEMTVDEMEKLRTVLLATIDSATKLHRMKGSEPNALTLSDDFYWVLRTIIPDHNYDGHYRGMRVYRDYSSRNLIMVAHLDPEA